MAVGVHVGVLDLHNNIAFKLHCSSNRVHGHLGFAQIAIN